MNPVENNQYCCSGYPNCIHNQEIQDWMNAPMGNPVENKQPSEWAMKKADLLINRMMDSDDIVEDVAKEFDSLKSQADGLASALEKIKYGQINHRSVDEKSWAHTHDSLIDFIDDTLEAYRKGE